MTTRQLGRRPPAAGNIAADGPASRSTLHDHPVAARHRPLQVHDDAGRAASFSRARRSSTGSSAATPDVDLVALHRARSKTRSARCARCASRSASSTTCAGGASSRATSSTCWACSISTSASSRSTRLPSRRREIDITIKGPWLHTILFEVPVLAIVSEVYFREYASPCPISRKGGGAWRRKIAQIERGAPTPSSASPTTARGGASRAPGRTR